MAQSSLQQYEPNGSDDSPMMSSSTSDHDPERKLDEEAEAELWQIEKALRMRTGHMTAREREELECNGDVDEQRKQLLDKFCHQNVARYWKDWLVEMIDSDDYLIQAGVPFDTDTRPWTVCKGLMKTLRARQGRFECNDCQCLNIQYFQPAGCDCPEPMGPLFTWDNKICPKCSICLRCHK